MAPGHTHSFLVGRRSAFAATGWLTVPSHHVRQLYVVQVRTLTPRRNLFHVSPTLLFSDFPLIITNRCQMASFRPLLRSKHARSDRVYSPG